MLPLFHRVETLANKALEVAKPLAERVEKLATNVVQDLKPEPARQEPGSDFQHQERTFADKLMGRSEIKRTGPIPNEVPDRNVKLTDDDLQELRNVLYAEISNRDPEKQKLESRVIVNTALNRIKQYGAKGRQLALAQVLREPNQYQGYAPDKPDSQYNVVKSGKGNTKKLAAIDAVLEELKGGAFKDETNGAVFYFHKPDGSIQYDDKRPLYASASSARPAVTRFEDGSTTGRDMSKDEIRKYGFKDRVTNLVEKVESKIPFLDTNFERVIRGELKKAYPLTDVAKGVLDNIDLRQGSSPGTGGEYYNSRNSIRAKAANLSKTFLASVAPAVRTRVRGAIAGENIALNDLDTSTVEHELTHALFSRQKIDDNEFLKDLEEAKKDKRFRRLADSIDIEMEDSGLYDDISQREKVNEYYAYIGGYLGSEGLSAIPKPLQKYYKNILKDEFPEGFTPGDDVNSGA